MTNKMILVTVLAALPLLGDENLKPPAASIGTQSGAFAPGGTIRVNGSYDDLYIEGWDQARVEVSVTKFMPYEFDLAHPQHPEHAAQNLETVQATLDRKSATEMDLTTTLPVRKGLVAHFPLSSKTNHVRIEYHVYVPRNSKLVIHHNVGLVSIAGVTGDIEAACHRGDIILWLPESGKYAIDAKNKLGKVSSDFPGAALARFLVGQQFKESASPPAQRLYLRMGFGGITLKPILPESDAPGALVAATK
jgi:hypothetical protein